MPSKLDKLLLVPDCHVPFHDDRAWKLMMKVARQFKPDTVVHLGDLADFYSVSAHSKNPERGGLLEQELIEVKKKRAELDRLKPKRKVFVEGNHEQRLIRYLQDKAPELNGLISLDSLLKLSENGWEHVPYRSHIKIGKLYLTHDVGSGGKYSTARAMETFQHSVAIGHHHAMQYAVQGDATGKHQVGAQFGWLGDVKKVDYMHSIKAKRAWSLGFGIGYHDLTTHYVYLQPVPIVNYTAVVEGRLYRG
jgi:predicted phosphodiesterase